MALSFLIYGILNHPESRLKITASILSRLQSSSRKTRIHRICNTSYYAVPLVHRDASSLDFRIHQLYHALMVYGIRVIPDDYQSQSLMLVNIATCF
jgi:hypothetical protein